MKRLSILFLLFVLTIYSSFQVAAQNKNQKVIWEIGNADNSYQEFALSPDGYKNFVPEGFGGANKYYVVGMSTPQHDFPYLLPGPKDGFAG